MTRSCLTCRRSALPGWTMCDSCIRKALQVFGPEVRDYRVERLSASMPELAIKGRKVA